MNTHNSIIAGAVFAIILLVTVFGVFAVFYAGNQQIVSTVSTGTAPFTVASTTKVTNLNVDFLDGADSSSFTNNRCLPYRTELTTSSTSYVRNVLCTGCAGWLHTIIPGHSSDGFNTQVKIEIDGTNSSTIYTNSDPMLGTWRDSTLHPTFSRFTTSLVVHLQSPGSFASVYIGHCREF